MPLDNAINVFPPNPLIPNFMFLQEKAREGERERERERKNSIE
jgi:hypothetical protein